MKVVVSVFDLNFINNKNQYVNFDLKLGEFPTVSKMALNILLPNDNNGAVLSALKLSI